MLQRMCYVQGIGFKLYPIHGATSIVCLFLIFTIGLLVTDDSLIDILLGSLIASVDIIRHASRQNPERTVGVLYINLDTRAGEKEAGKHKTATEMLGIANSFKLDRD